MPLVSPCNPAYFQAMRKLDDWIERQWKQHRALRPNGCELMVGSADFDYLLKAIVGEAFIRALRSGLNAEQAVEPAAIEGDNCVKQWNEKGSKGRVTFTGGHELKRWDCAGRSCAEDVYRQFKLYL